MNALHDLRNAITPLTLLDDNDCLGKPLDGPPCGVCFPCDARAVGARVVALLPALEEALNLAKAGAPTPAVGGHDVLEGAEAPTNASAPGRREQRLAELLRGLIAFAEDADPGDPLLYADLADAVVEARQFLEGAT